MHPFPGNFGFLIFFYSYSDCRKVMMHRRVNGEEIGRCPFATCYLLSTSENELLFPGWVIGYLISLRSKAIFNKSKNETLYVWPRMASLLRCTCISPSGSGKLTEEGRSLTVQADNQSLMSGPSRRRKELTPDCCPQTSTWLLQHQHTACQPLIVK